MAASKAMPPLPDAEDGEEKPLLSRQTANAPAAPSLAASRRVQAALYTSYFLAAWAWRAMEFTIALVLIDLYPDSLLLVSLYGLLDNGVRITLGSSVGSYIDRSGRWQGARNCYLLQNLCVSSAGLSLAAVLAGWVGTPGHPEDSDKPRYWLLVSTSLLLSSASSLGSTGVKIAVEKRMPKLLCTPTPSASSSAGNADALSHELSKMNSIFRAIDLVCLLASPIVSGVMMTYRSPAESLLLLVCYCLVAWVPELTLLKWAITTSPQLNDATPKTKAAAAAACNGLRRSSTGIEAPLVIAMSTSSSGLPPLDSEAPTTPSPRATTLSPLPASPAQPPAPGPRAATSCAGWGVYFRQPVLLANLALALLYMTVLSLGFLMTSFLKWSGLTEAEVSLYRGAGAITGLAATAIYPFLRRTIGTVNTGLLGITYQLTCLCVGVLPIVWSTLTAGPSSAVEGMSASPEISHVRLLIGSVVASRSGLWLFDLAVTQLVQDRVAAGELGVVCGVQSSVQSCFETASFLAGTFLTSPSQFWMLMSGSLGVVSTASVLYTTFVFLQPTPKGKQYQQVADKEQEQLEEC